MKKYLVIIPLILILFLMSIWIDTINATSTPQLMYIKPSNKDAWVFSTIPNSNFGTDNMIDVETWTDYRIGYISFDLSNLTDIIIVNATLQLYGQNNYPSLPVNTSIYRVTSLWYEYSITYNNQPTFNNTIIDTEIIEGSLGWYNWIITNDINYTIAHSSSWYGYRIYSVSTDGVIAFLYSKENVDISHRPRLMIWYTDMPLPIDYSGVYFKICLGIFCIIAIVLAPILSDKFAKSTMGKIFLLACIWLFFGFLFYAWIYMW